MRVRATALVVVCGLALTAAQAHLCNNIYRTPDRVIVKPEKDAAVFENGDQFRVFVLNNYPTMLRNVRLLGQASVAGVNVGIEPQAIPEMKPGQKEAFTVNVSAGQGVAQGKHSLKFAIAADNIGWGNSGQQPVGEVSDRDLLRAMGDDNTSCVVLAAESLARRKNQAGVDKLTELINNGYNRAIHAAGRSGNPALAPLLLSKLQDRNGMVVGMSCISLGLLKENLDAVRALAGHRDPFIDACANTALVLAGQGDEGSLDYLRQGLSFDDQWVRCAAAWGCAWLNDTEALKVLDQLVSSGDADLVVFAGDALLSLAERQEKQDAGEATEAVAPTAKPAAGPVLAAATADRLVAKPKVPMPNCAQGGLVEFEVYNGYPGPLHNVRVRPVGPGTTVEGDPVVLADLKPAQSGTVGVRVRLTTPGTADLVPTSFEVTADEIEQPLTVMVSLPCTDKGIQLASMEQAAPVGEMGVRVLRFGDYYLLLSALPLAAVLGALACRWRRQSHP
ncbi:MAG TPA: HEAT repeat domain-containing protein [Anaerolineae bacterium]|nr:HEAT repeat domain-containing protein [Anaerolineae bacterium]